MKLALTVLQAGGVVCLPTESSYGLAVDASNAGALKRLATIKPRTQASPFALIAGSLEQAQSWTGLWPPSAILLAREHWPGALTLILPPTQQSPAVLLGPSGGIALRVSSCLDLRTLALALASPITATSANPTAQPAATTIAQARAYFGDRVDHYVDGGLCDDSASTLVDFPQGKPLVLRQGPVVVT